MIETICNDCGARYRPGTDHVCPKRRPAKKSTAARKDVQATTLKEDRSRSPALGTGGKARHRSDTGNIQETGTAKTVATTGAAATASSRLASAPKIAGTQAPPVDTLTQAEAAAAHLAPDLTKRGTPRQRAPKGTFDRKAYQREKARERRAEKARLRAAQEPK